MKNSSKHFAIGLMAAWLLWAVVLSTGRADEQAPKKDSEPAESSARGLVGTPDKIGEPPAAGGRFKFRTGKHWCITEADPRTGQVIFHHGGTYMLDGDTYTETIEYANENTAGLFKMQLKFKVKVEGDMYTQIGDGNEFHEVWKRAK